MIRVEAIAKRYGGVTALDGLSFDVPRGETFAVIGPNGAGKTTTLKCLLGLVRPDAGRIAIGEAGLPPSDPRARAALGYVPQRAEFSPGRSVSELLGFFAELRGLGREAVAHALARVGLESYAERRANELSGGYIQRLSLAPTDRPGEAMTAFGVGVSPWPATKRAPPGDVADSIRPVLAR